MYKLVITSKYKLYNINNRLIGEFDNIDQVAEAAFDFIRTNELTMAIKFMCDTSHNVAEFGTNGRFTMSCFDEAYEVF